MSISKSRSIREIIFENGKIRRARKIAGNASFKHERFQFMGVRSWTNRIFLNAHAFDIQLYETFGWFKNKKLFISSLHQTYIQPQSEYHFLEVPISLFFEEVMIEWLVEDLLENRMKSSVWVNTTQFLSNLSERRTYCAFSTDDLSKHLQEDVDDSWAVIESRREQTQFWIGPAGTISQPHYDPSDNIFCQVHRIG